MPGGEDEERRDSSVADTDTFQSLEDQKTRAGIKKKKNFFFSFCFELPFFGGGGRSLQ